MIVLEIEDVAFRYVTNKPFILNGLNLIIKKGEKVGIIGDNGCGKSTISKLVLNILQPSSGQIKILGNHSDWLIHYPKLGYVGDPSHNCGQLGLPEGLTIKEILQIVKQLYKVPALIASLDTLAQELGVAAIEQRLVDSLSTGERKRLMLCLALFKPNDLIIFDEPLDGLDLNIKPTAQKVIKRQIKEGTSILYIGHDFSEIDTFTDKVYRLQNGQLTKIQRPRYSMIMNIDDVQEEYVQQKQGQIQSIFQHKLEMNGNFQKMSVELNPFKDEN